MLFEVYVSYMQPVPQSTAAGVTFNTPTPPTCSIFIFVFDPRDLLHTDVLYLFLIYWPEVVFIFLVGEGVRSSGADEDTCFVVVLVVWGGGAGWAGFTIQEL